MMNFINADIMSSVAEYTSLVAYLEACHRTRIDALDDLLMTQPAINGGSDTVLIRAAWQTGQAIGVKLITVFPGNADGSSLPAIQAVYTLFDGTDGRPLALLDGTELTYWKTAADSALGSKLLARDDAESLLMVGAGAQAPHLIRAHCAVRPSISTVSVWNRTPSKAQSLASTPLVNDVTLAPTLDVETAARRADIICTATAAEVPLIRGEWLKPGAHLDLVGGYKPEMVETDVTALTRSRVFVDCWDTTVDVCGDLLGPINAGLFSADAIEGDLFDLCKDGSRVDRRADDITVFKNGGGGHLDLMTAQYFVQQTAASS